MALLSPKYKYLILGCHAEYLKLNSTLELEDVTFIYLRIDIFFNYITEILIYILDIQYVKTSIDKIDYIIKHFD